MSGPSDKALEAGAALLRESFEHWQVAGDGTISAHEVLHAAHDPALGLDASVRLGDVVEALRSRAMSERSHYHDTADLIERQFAARKNP